MEVAIQALPSSHARQKDELSAPREALTTMRQFMSITRYTLDPGRVLT